MFTLLRDQTLKELTVHGNKIFPYEIYFGGISMWENGYMDWHWHDQFEINLVTSGTLTYFIENERYFLQEGEAVFINAGRLHHSYSQDQAQYSHTIVFGSELFCEDNSCEWYHSAIQPLIQSTRNGIHLTKEHRWMQSVLSHLHALYAKYEQRPFGYEVDIKGYLCLIFAEILQNTSHSQQPTQLETEKMKRMRKILSYISQNYQNNFSLSDLSAEVNLSESECSRFFRNRCKNHCLLSSTSIALKGAAKCCRIPTCLSVRLPPGQALTVLATTAGNFVNSYTARHPNTVKKSRPHWTQTSPEDGNSPAYLLLKMLTLMERQLTFFGFSLTINEDY